MGRLSSEEIRGIVKKYEEKLREHIEFEDFEYFPDETFSREYDIFRTESLKKKVSRYEQLCDFCERILKVVPKEKDRERLAQAIGTAHLNIRPEGATSFAAFVVLLTLLGCILLGLFVYIFSGETSGFFVNGGLKIPPFSSYFLPLVLLMAAVAFVKPLASYPLRVARRWRLRASNQMVLCILYIVMYMRHTSNLEHAIKFAGEHIGYPLALDLRKVLWDVETGKFVTIKESLDIYLEGWRDHSLEFVESFHLIESSLYESDESRRLYSLEKALEVILDGTYEKMLHYAHDLTSPMTMIYMLGVILPVLGLVLFPLMSGFLGGIIKWWHLALLYNIILPVFVYFFGMDLIEKRPTGYGSEDILDLHPEFKSYTTLNFFGSRISALPLALFVGGIFLLFGGLPLVLFYIGGGTYDFTFLGFKLLDYKTDGDTFVGPYGMWSMILSLFIPLGVALGIGTYYYFWSKELIKIRNNTAALEKEFSGAIFQLGNRVGDGIPVESAFFKVAESMRGTPTGDFLRIVSSNIRKLGMSVKEAVFNKERGGIVYFPSTLIKTSMKVLIQSAKKGPLVVSQSLITISEYVKRVNNISERLKDLLAEVISSMKSQISFLTPMIAGIVVGVTSMMINILNLLQEALGFSEESVGLDTAIGVGGFGGVLEVLNIRDLIPGYQFQIVVGLFVVEIAIILTLLSSGIENGIDKVTERNKIAKNLFISTGLYFLISLVSILVFSILASGVARLGVEVGGF